LATDASVPLTNVTEIEIEDCLSLWLPEDGKNQKSENKNPASRRPQVQGSAIELLVQQQQQQHAKFSGNIVAVAINALKNQATTLLLPHRNAIMP